MGATEIVQAFVSPAEKLIEAVSGAIGKAYEPKHVRKMADAKAYELKLISDTVRNNSDVPIVYDSTGVSIDTSKFEYEELENSEKVCPELVNPDWMFRFFDSVENISNEDMQKIWGHILAGEIKNPNTYSYRTLEKLKNMTQQEAEHFQLVASLALRCSNKNFILTDKNLLHKYNVYFTYLLELEECGLLTVQQLSLTITASADQSDFIYNPETIGIISGTKTESQKLQLSVHVFTESGSQLIKAIHPTTNSQYFIDCLELIREKHKDFVVTAHTINYISDEGKIDFNDVNILSSEYASDK